MSFGGGNAKKFFDQGGMFDPVGAAGRAFLGTYDPFKSGSKLVGNKDEDDPVAAPVLPDAPPGESVRPKRKRGAVGVLIPENTIGVLS